MPSTVRRSGGGSEEPSGGVVSWVRHALARRRHMRHMNVGSARGCRRLKGHTHKWESLLVWVGAWGGSLWLLVRLPLLSC